MPIDANVKTSRVLVSLFSLPTIEQFSHIRDLSQPLTDHSLIVYFRSYFDESCDREKEAIINQKTNNRISIENCRNRCSFSLPLLFFFSSLSLFHASSSLLLSVPSLLPLFSPYSRPSILKRVHEMAQALLRWFTGGRSLTFLLYSRKDRSPSKGSCMESFARFPVYITCICANAIFQVNLEQT